MSEGVGVRGFGVCQDTKMQGGGGVGGGGQLRNRKTKLSRPNYDFAKFRKIQGQFCKVRN